MARKAVIAFMLSLLGSCSSRVTQLVVLVDSDLEAPSELSKVSATVSLLDGVSPQTAVFDLNGHSRSLKKIPFSFAVAPPPDGDLSRQVSIELQAVTSSTGVEKAWFTRRVTTKFV